MIARPFVAEKTQSREAVLADLSQRFSNIIISAIGEEKLKKIPGHSYSGANLFNSNTPDVTRNGLRRINFIDKGNADSFWAFFNNKFGCALVFTFEKERKTVSATDMIVMQYNSQKGELAIKDVIEATGKGIEDDKTGKVPTQDLEARLVSLVNLLP